MPKYTVDYVKSNKVAIKVNSEEEVKKLQEMNCCGYIPKNYPFPYYTEPCNDTWWFNSSASCAENKDTEFIDFKTFIQDNMEKKIIGYKLIKPEYENAVNDISRTIAGNTTWTVLKNSRGYFGTEENPDTIKTLEKAGVLDLWFEPVYEPEKPKEEIISMGGFNLKITKEGIFHKNEDITSYVKHINTSFNMPNFGFKSGRGDKNWAFIIKDIVLSKTGCESSETTVNQWLKVWDKYQEFQK